MFDVVPFRAPIAVHAPKLPKRKVRAGAAGRGERRVDLGRGDLGVPGTDYGAERGRSPARRQRLHRQVAIHRVRTFQAGQILFMLDLRPYQGRNIR